MRMASPARSNNARYRRYWRQGLVGETLLVDVEEIDGETVIGGERTDGDPQVEWRIERLEDDRLAGRHCPTEFDVEHRADRFGEDIPDHIPEQLGAGPLLQAFGLGVDVGEAPRRVEGVERVGHLLEGADETRPDTPCVGLCLAQGSEISRPSDASRRGDAPRGFRADDRLVMPWG